MINKSIRDFEVPRFGSENGDTFTVQRLLQNGLRTPDGTEIFSRHRHDYITHTDKNGETYMVDGGLDYLRRSAGHVEEPEDLSVYVDDDHAINREYLRWGTRGVGGDQPLTWKKLKDMSTAHIHAVLDTQTQVPQWKRDILEEELVYRCNKELGSL